MVGLEGFEPYFSRFQRRFVPVPAGLSPVHGVFLLVSAIPCQQVQVPSIAPHCSPAKRATWPGHKQWA